MLEATIFDMDGLLIDSEPFWRQSHIEALGEYGVKITEDDVRAMAGKRTDEVVEHWRQTHDLLGVSNDDLESRVVGQVIEHIKQKGTTLEGATTLLKMLQARALPIAIASSSAPEVIEAVIGKLGLEGYITLAYSAKHEASGKPHPGVFLTTAQKLQVSPGNCVVFEDAASGIKAAKDAGMKCVAVPELVNANKPEIHKADLVLKSLSDVTWDMLTGLWD